MQVTDRIHLVKDPPSNDFVGFTGVYIVLGKEICLVDAGYHRTPEDRVFPYLKHLGRDPSEISLVVLTHGHGDHYEGIPAIKQASNAKVAVHEADAPLIEFDKDAELFRRLHLKYPDLFRPVREDVNRFPKADILLKDGDRLNLASMEAQVIHIPGHQEGSIALYQPDERLLFTGDSVSGDFLHFYGDVEEHLASIRRLMDLRVDLLLAAHRYPPATDAVLRGPEAKAFMERSIRAVEQTYERVKEFVKASKKPVSPREVADAIQGPTLITVVKMLEKMARDGEASQIRTETRYW